MLKLYFSSALLKDKMEDEKHMNALKHAAKQVLNESGGGAVFCLRQRGRASSGD